MISKSVDLPAPLGPMIPTSSPGDTSNEIARLAMMPPKCLEPPATARRLTARPARRRAGSRGGPQGDREAHGGPQGDEEAHGAAPVRGRRRASPAIHPMSPWGAHLTIAMSAHP